MPLSIDNVENVRFTMRYPCNPAQLSSILAPRRPAGLRSRLSLIVSQF